MKMAIIKNMKTIDLKIAENEEKLRKLKERCDNISAELDQLYEEKKALENQELLQAIRDSSKTRAEILAFLESK